MRTGIAILILAATGCDRQDADKLSRVGWKLTEKLQALVPDRSPFSSSPTAERSLEARVRARFASDKYLAPLPIEITATADGVRLRGNIEDDILRQRAVEMAQSTIGIENVVDELLVE